MQKARNAEAVEALRAKGWETSKRVLEAFARIRGGDPEKCPHPNEIGLLLNMNRRTVVWHIARLCDGGYLKANPANRRPVVARFTITQKGSELIGLLDGLSEKRKDAKLLRQEASLRARRRAFRRRKRLLEAAEKELARRERSIGRRMRKNRDCS